MNLRQIGGKTGKAAFNECCYFALKQQIAATNPHGFSPLLAECKGSNQKELWKPHT